MACSSTQIGSNSFIMFYAEPFMLWGYLSKSHLNLLAGQKQPFFDTTNRDIA